MRNFKIDKGKIPKAWLMQIRFSAWNIESVFPLLEDPGVYDEYITVAPDATIGKIDVWNF